LLSLAFLPLPCSFANSLDKFNRYDSAGLLYLDESGKVLNEKHPEDLLVPASTTKLVTAYLALNHWGEDYRFKTDFFLDESTANPTLWIKGYGDPFLISEELIIIARTIGARLKERDSIRLTSPGTQGCRAQQGAIIRTMHTRVHWQPISTPSLLGEITASLYRQRSRHPLHPRPG
jgi:hypothetical protein